MFSFTCVYFSHFMLLPHTYNRPTPQEYFSMFSTKYSKMQGHHFYPLQSLPFTVDIELVYLICQIVI